MAKLIFFDCEFTDLSIAGSLVSIGFIADSGEEFYVELSDFDEAKCNNFVKTTVLPLLTLRRISSSHFISSLMKWVGNFDEYLILVADSDWDRKMLAKTFASLGKTLPDNWRFYKTPDNFTNAQQRQLFNNEIDAFFLRNPRQRQHHALVDARAIRSAYKRADAGF